MLSRWLTSKLIQLTATFESASFLPAQNQKANEMFALRLTSCSQLFVYKLQLFAHADVKEKRDHQ